MARRSSKCAALSLGLVISSLTLIILILLIATRTAGLMTHAG